MKHPSPSSKAIALFGATGTIGDNALDIVRNHPQHYHMEVMTAHANAAKLIARALEFHPQHVVIADAQHYDTVRDALPASIHVHAGEDALVEAASLPYDMMISAIVGFSALRPTMEAIRHGRTIALANKECLVAAGALFMQACTDHGATLLPVDSEHNAVFQLWHGVHNLPPSAVTLTASGGPFRTWSMEAMHHATPTQAVTHPNWAMGAKISVDSATLMNKGLELIEAHHMFQLNPEQLHVLVHPQSMVHCLIHYEDGSHLAHMSTPDMRIPLAYAMHYPQRLSLNIPPLDLVERGTLTFEAPDRVRFPCLELAYHAMRSEASAAIMLNAANEIAVEAFLQGNIGFMDIPATIDRVMQRTAPHAISSLDEVYAIDHSTRVMTHRLITHIS
jgi:1-deoxy-D-xylulose-5-phosphate reductoisomerase